MNDNSVQWPYRIVLSGEPVGLLGEFSEDWPTLIAAFSPLPAYDKWVAIFSESLNLLKEGRTKLHRERMERIFDAGLAIVDVNGACLYVRTPRKCITGELAFVHIGDGSLRLRTF